MAITRILKRDLVHRGDGRVEWVCPHGCGHTIEVPEHRVDQAAYWVHGCDGCCSGKRAQWAAHKERQYQKQRELA